MKKRLKPVLPPAPEVIRALLADLDNDLFAIRKAAETQLRELGERAGTALHEALKAQPTLESRRRIEALLAVLESHAPLAGERLRAQRAVHVLERIGTADAREILERLSRGVQSARLTQAAKDAVARLAP